jgi:hypothetical protein
MATVAFGNLDIQGSLDNLPRNRENALRLYYLDGREVRIKRDLMEAPHSYAYRASFVIARSHNTVRLDELVINSRIAVNKRWAQIVTEGNRHITVPHYVEDVETAYDKVRKLPAFDAMLEKKLEETLYYEPEVGEEKEVEVGKETEKEEEILSERVEKPSYEIVKGSDGLYDVAITFPLYISITKDRVVRLDQVTSRDVNTILEPTFEAYSAKISGNIENVGRVTFDVDANNVVFSARFRTEAQATFAAGYVIDVVTKISPIEVKYLGQKRYVYYDTVDKRVVRLVAE